MGRLDPATHYTTPWGSMSAACQWKCTPMKYKRGWSWLFRLIARVSWLFPRTFPSDAVVLQDLWMEWVVPGQRISPSKMMWMFIGHGVKWPSSVMELHRWIKQQQLATTANHDAFIDGMIHTLRWAHGKPMEWMHKHMSGVGLMHATMGLVMFATSMGLIEKMKDEKKKSQTQRSSC